MKVKSLAIPVVLLTLGICPLMLVSFNTQQKEPWTDEQLLDPQELAITLNNPQSHQPILLSIGPAAIIKNSNDIGPTREKENLDKLEQVLKATPKDETIVLYCGCCPFDKCPNIRPAFKLLNQKGFKNHKLLNLTHNIKVDWIDRGYPVAE